ncbi:serine hydrolase [Streptomyces sp. GC420]|uniref:serine hydrolase domain-containing protein n=1 Tax=Streptomyces sp. GC420 TaxID=2697568 RepID=UPI001414D17E|nr:serine hydrolase [Streptomyces sp. GC420]NBM16622.1 serine hydrolase [Streptomyces sp. GC420]
MTSTKDAGRTVDHPSGDGRVRVDGGRPWPITLDNWQDAPFSRWAFAHAEEIVPTATVRRAGPAAPRETVPETAGDAALGRLPVPFGGTEVPLDDFLAASFADAFVVSDRSGVRYESYRGVMDRRRRHLLMSVSKSLCGLLVGQLAGEGLLDPAEPAAAYVPELAGSAFGTATLQQVLDMTVAVEYSEDYHDPASHVQQQDRLAGWRPRLAGDPDNAFELLASLRASGRHGERFQYCSAATDVLAWVAERVTGTRYADLLSRRLWQHLPVADDAQITVDPAGFAFANGGMSTTARDLGAVGRLVLDHGLVGDRRVVPAGWLAATTSGGDHQAARGTVFQGIHPRGSYRNHWWVTGDDHGSVYATGIYGQFLWIDPTADVVVVKFSSLPVATTADWSRAHARVFRRICESL